MTFLEYCRGLKPEDWNVQVTDKWTIKDVIAHLVGWEKEVTNTLDQVHKTGKPAWFMRDNNWHKFNDEIVESYKSYSPKELLDEWQSWQKKLEAKIKKLGEQKFRDDKDMSYLFDDESSGESSHYMHHWKQIRQVLEK